MILRHYSPVSARDIKCATAQQIFTAITVIFSITNMYETDNLLDWVENFLTDALQICKNQLRHIWTG
jgi:hypothetical protein